MEASLEHNKWLSQLSQAISQDEWLRGLNLYRENRVTKVDRFEHLIYGTILTVEGKEEVRLKMHPKGGMVQWVECTCVRNRKKGLYCEHIVALFLHVHQEREDFGPATSINTNTNSNTVEPPVSENVLDGLFEQGRGGIISIAARQSHLLVEFEVKTGYVSQVDLNIDRQPSFINSLAPSERKMLPPEFRKLKNLKEKVSQGVYFFLNEQEKVIAKKVLVTSVESRQGRNPIARYHKECQVFSGLDHQEFAWVELFPAVDFSAWVGSKYFVIPGLGYVLLEEMYNTWEALESVIEFSDEQAIDLISNNFLEYRQRGKVFLSKELSSLKVVNNVAFTKINLLQEKDGWFYLDPRYQSEEKSFAILDILQKYSKKKSPFYKSENVWMRVPNFILENNWTIDTKTKSLKVRNLDFIKLKQSVGLNQITGKDEILARVKEATEFSTPTNMPSLAHTKLVLREYQKRGVEWLWWLYDKGLHGLLADEMGLGKTHQAMGLMSAVQAHLKNPVSGPLFLCICPTTVLDHWMDKVESFAPNLKVLKYYGSKRETLIKNFSNYHTIVTSYGILLRDIALLEQFQWRIVILDEAHFVKNNRTATYKAACRLKSQLRLCLSGTPIENRLGELKNLFDFIVPGYLGSDRDFYKNYVAPIEMKKSEEKAKELRSLIHPFKLRRLKEQVLRDLPEKIEDTRYCWLSPEQVALYKEILSNKAAPLVDLLKKTEQPSIPYLHVFTVLQLLKQVCNHPALVKKNSSLTWRDGQSGKFELFKEILAEALASNQKVVIFSQYLQMIEFIRDYLTELKVGHVVLNGQSQRRGEIVKQFQTDPEVRVFVGSLLAGSVGIDLTAASVVIHYDRWWNASKENQATDRVHRIGRENVTQVFKLVTRGTLEEKIDQMIAQKAELFNRFLEKNEEVFKSLTRDDLLNLLQ